MPAEGFRNRSGEIGRSGEIIQIRTKNPPVDRGIFSALVLYAEVRDVHGRIGLVAKPPSACHGRKAGRAGRGSGRGIVDRRALGSCGRIGSAYDSAPSRKTRAADALARRVRGTVDVEFEYRARRSDTDVTALVDFHALDYAVRAVRSSLKSNRRTVIRRPRPTFRSDYGDARPRVSTHEYRIGLPRPVSAEIQRAEIVSAHDWRRRGTRTVISKKPLD